MTARDYARRMVVSAILAIVLVVASAAALFWTRHRLIESIAALDSNSDSITQVADELRDFCVSREKQSEAAALRKDTDERLRDIQNPAAVVSRLSEACRKHGAIVLEISPIVPPPTALPRNPAVEGKRYKIVVRGSYRQVATLLDACPRLRLPARVVEFNITPAEGPNVANQLNAIVVVESFVAPVNKPEAPHA